MVDESVRNLQLGVESEKQRQSSGAERADILVLATVPPDAPQAFIVTALGAEHNLFQRVHEILLMHRVLIAAGGEKRGLVHQVPDVGSGDAWRGGRDLFQTHILEERHFARVNL